MGAPWLLPALGYAVTLGVFGIATKLSLRTLDWQEFVLWAALWYAVAGVALMALRGTRLHLTVDGGFAAVAGVLAVVGLALIFLAPERGDVSQVIPFSSAYPLITLILAAVFLSERITVARSIGSSLVVVGVILLSR